MSDSNRSTRTSRVLAALALVAAVGLTSVPAFARGEGHGRHGRGEGRMGRFLPPAGYLDLDAGQEAATDTIREQTRAQVRPLMQEQRDLRKQLRDAVDAANPDATAIGNLTLQVHANRDRIKAIFEKAETDFVALLNAAQREKYQNFRELRDERREERREKRMSRRGGDGRK